VEKRGIVGFAFGTDSSILSNERIGRIASYEAKLSNSAVFTQLDVHIERGVEIEYITDGVGNPPPTLRIARGAAQWAKRLGVAELKIVAASPHRWRCKRDLEYALREAGVKAKVLAHIPLGDEGWFCENSTQTRTRSPWRWWPREIILRLLPMSIYKRVAG